MFMHVYMRFELAESDIQGLFIWGELAWPTLVFNAILTSKANAWEITVSVWESNVE